MQTDEFIRQLLQAAVEAGFSVAEAYLLEDESFRAVATNGEITQYASHATRGLGFRGVIGGRMGYASTEAFDEAAVDWLLQRAKDSATLCEDPSEQLLYDGREPVADLPLTGSDAPAEEKLAFALALERHAKAVDPRVAQVGYDTVVTGRARVHITNTLGLDKAYTESFCGAYLQPVAREGDSTSTGMDVQFARDFSALDALTLAEAAARRALDGLHAAPVPSGSYRVAIENLAMTDLLETFAPAFSAENAQKGLSLLQGRIGEAVAAPCVTITDDSLRPDGFGSRPFDAEGVPGRRNAVVEGGVFRTFLHNLKTARKDGVPSTGNASKGSYAAPVRVSPTNFYLEPGEQTPEALLAALGDGLLITEVEGLHAGANAVTGDFSLLSKGFVIRDGHRAEPVEQITVGGNFFTLLKNIRAIGTDLRFPSGGIGAPTVDAGTLRVAGKDAGAES
ncbi:MAG: metallopeptidase TldD-related protein [Candidatus Limiplasma sp.]|nr:metallopeptidase TldD-related protein [Candidatus Limiplasma sp.]